ncbi:Sphingolipid delta(4)-desaturase DES1 [Astathelohania contejeani]|uniref:Sphingolipid delta(4)-desaturase DES1 n=1 Tax=Astathelohania contejeani TaxID=164912 RepID=A0ABQ7I0E7_9MICR|nr:Sphingolipid delta(4)-desaturase DES1 [Thelohania contejeani]
MERKNKLNNKYNSNSNDKKNKSNIIMIDKTASTNNQKNASENKDIPNNTSSQDKYKPAVNQINVFHSNIKSSENINEPITIKRVPPSLIKKEGKIGLDKYDNVLEEKMNESNKEKIRNKINKFNEERVRNEEVQHENMKNKENTILITNKSKYKKSKVFLGSWKISVPYKDDDFAVDTEFDEPHLKRKHAILEDHPEIINFYGYSKLTLPIAITSVLVFYIGIFMATKYLNSWISIFLFCYFFGGSFSALSGVLMHECSHLTAASSFFLNELTGILANLMILIPVAASFKKYHLDHHAFLGVRNKDPDLPLPIEIKMVRGNTICKLFYICCYPVFYVIRSLFIKKKILRAEIINVAVHILFMGLVWRLMGLKAIFLIGLSSWLGYSIHPAAGHLIQEHFTFADGQETYSYYGPLNTPFMNIGYHNEHHDFMSIPWDRLPDVNKTASEYYEPLYKHYSWSNVLFRFITGDIYGPQSRVARDYEVHRRGRSMKLE